MPIIRQSITPMVFWTWGDTAIENPRKIKTALEALHDAGVKGFYVLLKDSRYTLYDRKVIRTVAQVSQWSKKRGLAFWIYMDPRQSSRKFISETGENLQFLHTAMHGGGKPVTPLTNPQFEIEFNWPTNPQTSWLQEKSLSLQPVQLERAFLFQATDGQIIPGSIHDITKHTQMTSNIAERRSSVFGEIHLPSDEAWYVCAFPKFDTNLYDYTGRESNDSLSQFIEDLFDGCSHIDGIAWAEGGPPSMVPAHYLPISLSLINSFKYEKGYDILDKLYALIFDCSNNEHIRVRRDYFSFLNKALLLARHDFHTMLHSFFPGVRLGAHYLRVPSVNAVQRNSGSVDPWKNIQSMSAAFCLIEKANGRGLEGLLPRIIAMKSMASQGQRPIFVSLDWHNFKPEERNCIIDWLMVLGLEASPRLHKAEDPSDFELDLIAVMKQRHTQYRAQLATQHPFANTLVIYPYETLITADLNSANRLVNQFGSWTVELMEAGIQADIYSTAQLLQGRLAHDGLHLCGRVYQQVIAIHPRVLSPQVAQSLDTLNKANVPVYFLGSETQWDTDGKALALENIPLCKSVEQLLESGVKPLLTPLANTVSALYQDNEGWCLLMAPIEPGQTLSGQVTIGDRVITVPPSQGLTRLPVA